MLHRFPAARVSSSLCNRRPIAFAPNSRVGASCPQHQNLWIFIMPSVVRYQLTTLICYQLSGKVKGGDELVGKMLSHALAVITRAAAAFFSSCQDFAACLVRLARRCTC